MLGVAMISKWHVHAAGYAREFNESKGARVACVWDEDAARGEAWAKELNVPFEPVYEAALARGDVDAVCVCSPTNAHEQLMIKAARAKKHIFTEKVMCLRVDECENVIRAARANDIVFTISFPHRCFPENLYIKDAIDGGMLGDITRFRVRNCHNGALANWLPDYWYDPVTTGGGAMMDLGAHPMYLSRWLLGKPARIQSAFTSRTGRGVEDDAVSVITFDNGAVAIAETSLVAPHSPRLMEVYGTKGVIISENGKLRVKTDEADWFEPALPERLKSPVEQFIDSALNGAPVNFGLDEGRELTELMENAYRAHRERAEIAFA